MHRFSIRDLIWLTIVVSLGVSLALSQREVNRQYLDCLATNHKLSEANRDLAYFKWVKDGLVAELDKHYRPVRGWGEVPNPDDSSKPIMKVEYGKPGEVPKRLQKSN